MPRLVLINGAPGSGTSTMAALLAGRLPDALLIDVDEIRRSLPEWATDHLAAGRIARSQAVDASREHLALDRDVVIAHHLAKNEFVQELQAEAGDLGAACHEIVLVVPAAVLRDRLVTRGPDPVGTPADRIPGPQDAPRLAVKVHELLIARPRAERVDASGTVDQTLAAIMAALADPWDAD